MSGSRKRVGVLGTFVWDTIHHPDLPGEPIEQWGGLAYCLSAWAAACPPEWEIVPIAMVGADLAEAAESFLSRLPHIASPTSIEIVPEPNNRVELRYRDAAERTELLTGGVPPWSFPRLAPHVASIDALYINHLSGMEMRLETALRLAETFDGPTYADLHSLFLEPPCGRPREPCRLAGWESWMRTADYVQLNESELALLGPAGEPPLTATEVARYGRRAVLVTRGAAGAEYAIAPMASGAGPDARHAPEVGIVPLPSDPLPGDPTGCGDIWGSVAFAGLLEGEPLPAAMRRAHVAAAARLRHGRIEGLPDAIAAALRA